MKANRRPRDDPRGFARDERGVSEAVGYIITFGISTIVLVTSLQAFLAIQRHTNDIAVDRAVKEVSAQVAFAVDEALRAGATYPDASFSMTLTVPRDVSGEGYRITLYETYVQVIANNADPSLTDDDSRGRSKANYVQRADVDVHCNGATTPAWLTDGVCSVLSQEGELTIVYKDPDGTVGPATAGVYIERDA